MGTSNLGAGTRNAPGAEVPRLPHYETSDPEEVARVLPDKSRPVIVYCMSGHRRATAKQRLEALGYQDVRDGASYESLRRLIIKTSLSSRCRRFR